MPKASSARRTRSTDRDAAPSSSAGPRAKKISITVDEGVLGEVRALIRGTGRSLSSHVSEALARDLRLRRLENIIREYEEKQGPIGDDELEAIRRRWRG